MRAHMRTRSSTDFSRIRLIWQNLAEVDQAGRIRQNSVKASEFIYRVFHRDIPTVPCQKSPCERIFQTTLLAKLLYNNHIINSKAIKNILSLYYI